MLEMIHKFAMQQVAQASRYTETHTQIDKWGCANQKWAENVESTENALVAQL